MVSLHARWSLILAMVASPLLAQAPSSAPSPSPTAVAPSQAAASASPEVAETPTPGLELEKSRWDAWVDDYMKVIKVRKGLEMRVDATHAYPDPRVRSLMEIVNEDDDYVYLRNLPLEDPRSAGHKSWLFHEKLESRRRLAREQLRTKFVLPGHDVEVPAPTIDRLVFEEHSQGLPKDGLWQMGFDVADFNGDKRLDLALPPARKGFLHPWVVLNLAEGWKAWPTASWPQDISFDYGDVKVADFDGDGNLDIAIANHFKKAYILYGDGKGGFGRPVELARSNPNMTSRALAVADFDGDGRPDIVQLAELDIDLGTSRQIPHGLVVVNLNTKNGWVMSPATFPEGVYGDKVVVGDFDGDGSPDILTASHKSLTETYIFLNRKKGTEFFAYKNDALPYRSYVFGVAAGSLDGKKPDQALLAVTQRSTKEDGSNVFVHAILAYRVADRKGKLLPQPQRQVVYRDQAGDFDQFRCLAAGDLDGDKRLDVVAGRSTGGVVVLLQMPDGGFAVQKPEGLGLGDAAPNHLMIRDLDGDGRSELIANFSDGKQTPGSIRVWSVSRRPAAAAAKTAK